MQAMLAVTVPFFALVLAGWQGKVIKRYRHEDFYVPGVAKYNGASITIRPLVRCAQIVDGKPVWAAPAPCASTTVVLRAWPPSRST